MKTVEATQPTAPLAEYVRHLSAEPLIITFNGKPVAALVSVENIDVESASLSTNPEFLAIIERSRYRLASEGGISGEEIRRRLKIRE